MVRVDGVMPGAYVVEGTGGKVSFCLTEGGTLESEYDGDSLVVPSWTGVGIPILPKWLRPLKGGDIPWN